MPYILNTLIFKMEALYVTHRFIGRMIHAVSAIEFLINGL